MTMTQERSDADLSGLPASDLEAMLVRERQRGRSLEQALDDERERARAEATLLQHELDRRITAHEEAVRQIAEQREAFQHAVSEIRGERGRPRERRGEPSPELRHADELDVEASAMVGRLRTRLDSARAEIDTRLKCETVLEARVTELSETCARLRAELREEKERSARLVSAAHEEHAEVMQRILAAEARVRDLRTGFEAAVEQLFTTLDDTGESMGEARRFLETALRDGDRSAGGSTDDERVVASNGHRDRRAALEEGVRHFDLRRSSVDPSSAGGDPDPLEAWSEELRARGAIELPTWLGGPEDEDGRRSQRFSSASRARR